jgi:hypothetical protein
VRDAADKMPNDVENLLRAFAGFKEVKMLIIESDSQDDTLLKLRELRNNYSNIEYISLGSLRSIIPERIDRLSYCRQFALSEISSRYPSFDYVCVADLDGMNTHISSEGVESCWEREEWDVCAANQLGHYYDVYALRHPTWCPQDYSLDERKLLDLGMHPMKARRVAVHKKQRKISKKQEWIEVDSAFGGLAIYRMPLFMRGKYSSRQPDTGNILCEHVFFHENLKKQGAKIFINPKLINCEIRRFTSTKSLLRYLHSYVFSMIAPRKFLKWEEERVVLYLRKLSPNG